MGNVQTTQSLPSLSEKVAIVTGASSGLGIETAKALAEKGAKVIFAVRDVSRGEEVAKSIRSSNPFTYSLVVFNLIYEGEFPNAKIEVLQLKLNSLGSVESFAKEFLNKNYPLHILINNAGIMMTPFEKTTDGIEQQFGVNHVGHFYLTRLLKEKLLETAKREEVRIVSLSSGAHEWCYEEGPFLTLDLINSESKYDPKEAYGQSKLANLLFIRKLQKLFLEETENIYCNAVNPGLCNTNLARSFGETYGLKGKLMSKMGPLVAKSPSDGSINSLYASAHPDITEQNKRGEYILPGKKNVPQFDLGSQKSQDSELGDKVWEFTEQILEQKVSSYEKW